MSVSRNATYSLLATLLPIPVTLLTVPLYLKSVGVDRFGVLSIAWVFLGYFGVFDFGLGRAVTHRIAALRERPGGEASAIFWTAFLVNAALGVVGALLLWGVTWWYYGHSFQMDAGLRAEALAAMPLLALSLPASTMIGVTTGALQGREKFAATSLVNILYTLAFQLLPLLVSHYVSPQIPYVLGAGVFARYLSFAVLFLFCRREFLAEGLPVFLREEVRPMLTFGGWLTVGVLFAPLMLMLDRFYLGALIGPAAVATYSIAMQLGQRVTTLPQALLNAVFPRLAGADRALADRLSEKALQVLLLGLTPAIIAGIFLAGPFFRLWLGSSFNPAVVPVAQILLAGFWVNSLAYVPTTRLQATGRPDIVSKLLMLELPFYLLLLWAGVRAGGLVGAALALGLRQVADYALLTISTRQFAAGRATVALLATVMAAAAIARDDGGLGLEDAGMLAACLGAMLLIAVLTLPLRSLLPQGGVRAVLR